MTGEGTGYIGQRTELLAHVPQGCMLYLTLPSLQALKFCHTCLNPCCSPQLVKDLLSVFGIP